MPLFSCCQTAEIVIKENPAEERGNDFLECLIEDSIYHTGNGSRTKTSISAQYVPIWNSGDVISVLTSDGINSPFTLYSGESTAIGTFRGTLPAGNVYHAWYPYSSKTTLTDNRIHFLLPQTQNCMDSDFAQDANVMYASFASGENSLLFKNVFGLLELQLSGTSKVSKITLTSKNDSDMLWGDCHLLLNGNQATDSQEMSVENGSNEAYIKFSSPVQLSTEKVKPFYFILPSGTLSSGFCIDIYDESGSLIYTKVTSKSQTITRSAVRIMPAINDVNIPVSADITPDPTTWSAYNNFARTGTSDATVIDPQSSNYPAYKSDKVVGMFYFVWHDAFSSQGPRNIQDMLGTGNYAYSPNLSYLSYGNMHWWGQPYLGYYRDTDSWVIRKHAQMLSDAGVDFIAFDVTNDSYYQTEISNILNVFKEMRKEGNKTPQVTFICNTSSASRVQAVYNAFYNGHSEWAELWFNWDGKPLMLAEKSSSLSDTIKKYFTFRRSWFLWNNHYQTTADANDPWWGDGVDKWPWGCCYTDNNTNMMKAGTHNGVNECASVMPATHPISNIGRSYPVGSGIKYDSGANQYTLQPEKGIYFKSQFAASNALDPKVMFFTGWNEWTAQRLNKGTLNFNYMGGVNASGGIFVDQYDYEFSRDIEPLNDGFGDNYYYYLVDFIRTFKGVKSLPVYSVNKYISIDGKFADWINVESAYADDKGDNKHRGYDTTSGSSFTGIGNNVYTNTTGRNDLLISKVANDGVRLYFYIEADGNLTGYSNGLTGLNLYLKTSASANNWEGFNYKLHPTSATKATLFRCDGGWNWTNVSTDIEIAVSGKCMEVAIPISSLGLSSASSISLDFKWVDNVNLSKSDGIQQCMRDGDSAPNGRFCYRYIFKNN